MKISPDRADAFAARPDPKARAVLVYGPDEGLVRERVQTLMKTVVEDLNDPFRVADLAQSAVKSDPALLADEAAAMALTGGRRVVRLRDADDGVTKAFKALLDDPVGDALIIAQGGDLAAKSSLRKLFEAAPNAAAIACYLDSGQAVETVIRDSLAKAGLGIQRDALGLLSGYLGGDRQVTRAEVEKLITYMGGPGQDSALEITPDDVLACVGDVSALSLDDMIYALADGDDSTTQALLDRLVGEGQALIGLLRTVSRHFMRLHLAGGAMAHGKSADQALALLKPPVFFKVKGRFLAQLRKWPPARAAQALDLLLEAEMDCKTTGMPEYEIVSRVFLQISRAARRSRG
jgi:DNA polymerase-3 subunit delta